MPVIVIPTPYFKREAKSLMKNYISLKDDLKALTQSLKDNPRQGDMLSVVPNIYKVRLAVKSKGKGKSAGVRIITHVEVLAILEPQNDQESEIKVRLITIYDKSDYETVDLEVIKEIIEETLEDEQSQNE